MPSFTFTARTPSGELRSGELEAASRAEAAARLRRQRLVPVSIKARPREIVFGTGVRSRDLVIFTRQLSTLVAAGLPLAQGLTILADQTENRRFRTVLGSILAEIQSGLGLADALRRHPKIFPELYMNMVAAGEAGGVLEVVLERLALFLEKSDALARRIRAAMTYPAVMLCVTIAATTILLWKVVPVFAAIFVDAEMALPLATRAVLGLSEFLQGYFYLLVLAVAGAAVAFRRYRATPAGRLAGDRMLLRAPMLGTLVRKAAVARFTRTLGTLVASGVPLLQGLEITARTAGNRVVHDAVMRSRASIAGGSSISGPLRASGVFPTMVVQMINVGEQTGGLEAMLGKVADFYDDEVDAAVSALTSVLEPVMVVVMGVVIGGMVVAMYLPMFDLIHTVQG